MRIEAPEFIRCCCCLPLRYGLIVWGYFKLLTSSLASILFAKLIIDGFAVETSSREIVIDMTVKCLVGFAALFDFILTIAFIIGCYKKNVKLIRTYYFYSSVLLALTIALSICILCKTTRTRYSSDSKGNILGIFLTAIMEAFIFFGNAATQIYILLLLRSEINKIKNTTELRFVNHAAEAECILHVSNKHEEENTKAKNKDDNDGEIRYA